MSGGDNLHIHLDAIGGIAGDMFVAALIDAMPALRERVVADCAEVLADDRASAAISEGESAGLRALRFGLSAPPNHAHGATYRSLVARIRDARLHDGTADAAIAILSHLARVEARIHGVAVDDVHFHEIGALDSLMDVVAAGSIASALRDARWSISELPLGRGCVRTAHGALPVPAPATAELLKGFRWRDDGIDGERVTPTGAAIVRYLIDDPEVGATPHGRLASIGTGAGTRELRGAPNVLRALVFDVHSTPIGERVAVLSFDVDDMTGEEIGVAADRLRSEPGVLDVSLAARIGKKSRPLTSFRVLVDPSLLEPVQRRCFNETSTIGLRWRIEERVTLARRITAADVGGDSVRVKQIVGPEGIVRGKAESDDLVAIDGLTARRIRKADAESAS